MSQPQIAKHLGVKDYSDVSKYELGKNEPPLVVLLAYSKLSGHSINDLADDRVNLSA
jgi:transcriptional regulator with XRE-family HTH domain